MKYNEAIDMILDGGKARRHDWENKSYYICFEDDELVKNFFISKHDVFGNDWIVEKDGVVYEKKPNGTPPMKGCKDCEEREKWHYEAQASMMYANPYIPHSFESHKLERGVEQYCSICDKKDFVIDRSYGVEHTYFLKYKDVQWLHFKGICQACNDYIDTAQAEDVLDLHKKLSKKNNPLKKKKSLWGSK